MEIVVCTCRNGGIGQDGAIPWGRITEDMKLFRELTVSNIVVMGRKTFESIGKHLPERDNIVLSQEHGWEETMKRTAELVKKHPGKKVFIIGGESIYRYALENLNVQRIHQSHLDEEYICDTHFPTSLVKGFEVSYVETLGESRPVTYTILSHYNREERDYLHLLKDLLQAPVRQTRNAKCYTLFGRTLEFDLSRGTFPLLTTKKMFLRGVFEELKFFLLGRRQTKELEAKNVNIWKGNTCREFLAQRGLPYEDGDMGPMYGYQWRNFNGDGYDQFAKLMVNLKENPLDRRHLMTSFNPLQAEDGVLWPCHGISIQFDCEPHHGSYLLNCMMHQRSADTFLGLPFNIASYGILMIIMANILGYKPGRLIMTLGNVHLYEQHIEAATTQLQREPRPFPSLICGRKFDNIEDITFDDFTLLGYTPYEKIEAPMIA